MTKEEEKVKRKRQENTVESVSLKEFMTECALVVCQVVNPSTLHRAPSGAGALLLVLKKLLVCILQLVRTRLTLSLISSLFITTYQIQIDVDILLLLLFLSKRLR